MGIYFISHSAESRIFHNLGVYLVKVLVIFLRLTDTVEAFYLQGWRTKIGLGVLHPIPLFELKECVILPLLFYVLAKGLCNYLWVLF